MHVKYFIKKFYSARSSAGGKERKGKERGAFTSVNHFASTNYS